jgi:hypothetical protein
MFYDKGTKIGVRSSLGYANQEQHGGQSGKDLITGSREGKRGARRPTRDLTSHYIYQQKKKDQKTYTKPKQKPP